METFEISELTLVVERYASEGGTEYTVHVNGELLGYGETLDTALHNARADLYAELTRDAEWA